MKIIKNNYIFPKQIRCINKPFPYSTRSLCPSKINCNSLLEIEETDIKKVNWIDYVNKEEGYAYGVKCPICKNFIIIDENQLPLELKNIN